MTVTVRGSDVVARLDADYQRRTARAREAFLDASWTGNDATHVVRRDLVQSWKRSKDSGVIPDDPLIPRFDGEFRPAGRLEEAMGPIMARLNHQWEGAGIWALVLDRAGVQVLPAAGDPAHFTSLDRMGAVPGAVFQESVSGTSGATLSLVRMEPSVVVGNEHFPTNATPSVTIGMPLRDALGRMQGLLVVCSRVESATPLLIPYVADLADAMNERLVATTDHGDRALFGEFLRRSATPSTPVVVMSERFCGMNTAAQQLLSAPHEFELVRNEARDAVAGGRSASFSLSLGGDTYQVRCRALESGSGPYGVVATLHRVTDSSTSAGAPPGTRTDAQPARILERARAHGVRALVQGERGSGRGHLAHRSGSLAEVDAADAGHDPRRWLDRLRGLLTRRSVLIRDIDELPADILRAALTIVDESASWCVATAGTAAGTWAEAFPVVVTCAPLRQRRADIPSIVSAVLSDSGNADVRCSAEALSVLTTRDWPGNVSELRRVVLHALVAQSGGRITLEHLPNEIVSDRPRTSGNAIDRMERELIFEALKNAGWRRDAAADALGISRSTMYRKLRRFPFQVPSSRT
ncbi:helix-turn-helix domain-containing protein [Microbacterium sp. 18062]|uniref:helix-turn-helix domain-containing protein n=1 Tax=Microbacterium sp. 18062 TaxID=2681410 RepID=UPI001356C8F4|nr:helix-turn-helix domain-containing protein [Microbacterium sp. 18062]